MFFVEPSSPGTTLGQIIIFVGFLINTAVQLWKDRNARKDAKELAAKVEADAERARKEAQEREERIKRNADAQHAKTRAEMAQRLGEWQKKLNGLLEEH